MPSISIPAAAVAGIGSIGAGAAIAGAGALSAGASIYSANTAADAQKKAAEQGINAQQQMFNVTQANLQPFRQAGQASATTLQNLLTGSPQQISQTLSSLPGYQWQLGQGLQSVQNSAAARGLGTSGAALRGAADYVNGLTSTNFTNYANLLQNNANMGESAAAGVGSAATQTGQGIASSLSGIGNAQAAGSIAAGNAISGLGNSVSGLYLTNALMQNNGGPGLFGGGGGLYGGTAPGGAISMNPMTGAVS